MYTGWPKNCRRVRLFSDINVSQGSVATYARCGGILNNQFTIRIRVGYKCTIKFC